MMCVHDNTKTCNADQLMDVRKAMYPVVSMAAPACLHMAPEWVCNATKHVENMMKPTECHYDMAVQCLDNFEAAYPLIANNKEMLCG